VSVKKEHIKIYDAIDRMATIIQELNNISQYVDDGWRLPNSLQSMLGKIYRYEGKSVSEISKIYDIDLKNTTKYVGELEKRGFLYKEKLGKRKILYLTDEGRTLHDTLSRGKGVLLDRIVDCVSEEELDTTLEVLGEMMKQSQKYHLELKDD